VKLSSVVVNVPHSAASIPTLHTYVSDAWVNDFMSLTDWATGEMIDVDLVDHHIAPFNRVWCDVERFDDADESRVLDGHGFYYTQDAQGQAYRVLDTPEAQEAKAFVYERFYKAYHDSLESLLRLKMLSHETVTILDLHSFSDEPGLGETYLPKPDFCLGADLFHTPPALLHHLLTELTKLGYSVDINHPFEGSFVPRGLYHREPQVQSVMIEVNKRLYMQPLGDLASFTKPIPSQVERFCRQFIMPDRLAILRLQLTSLVQGLDNAL